MTLGSAVLQKHYLPTSTTRKVKLLCAYTLKEALFCFMCFSSSKGKLVGFVWDLQLVGWLVFYLKIFFYINS